MSSHRAGLAIALAAILVQAPRLVLALLAADRLPVAPSAERALLVIAGIGTALVLTGGNLYLAHTVAQVRAWRRTLAAAWLAVLAASGGLVLPLIVAGLSGTSVSQVLGAGGLEWPWAVLAAVAHELTAAGCVLASAAWVASAAGTTGSAGTGGARGAGAMPAGAVPAGAVQAGAELAQLPARAAAVVLAARLPAEGVPAGEVPAKMRAGAVPAGASPARKPARAVPEALPAGAHKVGAVPAVATEGSAIPGAAPAGSVVPVASSTEAGTPGLDTIPCRSGCGRSFVSRQAEIAHLRHCPSRQEQLTSLRKPAGV
jgi:hypothetical protein